MSFDLKSLLNLDQFLLAQSRMYWPLLLISLIVILYNHYKIHPQSLTLKNFFSSKALFHKSSLTDIKYFFMNNFIRILFYSFASTLLISSFELSSILLSFLNQIFGKTKALSTDWFTIKLSYTLFSFLIIDLFRFVQHVFMHKIPFLWTLHKVHHSAEILTPLSLYRIHPIEMFIGMLRSTLAITLSTALYVYLFQVPISGFQILGVNILGFLFNALGANLRHSHVWISFGIFEFMFISPAQHQIHHSSDPAHFNKNYGVCLSIWDQLLGSFYKTSKKTTLSFGVKNTKRNTLNHIQLPSTSLNSRSS